MELIFICNFDLSMFLICRFHPLIGGGGYGSDRSYSDRGYGERNFGGGDRGYGSSGGYRSGGGYSSGYRDNR